MKLPQEFDLHALEVFVMTVELGGMSQCANAFASHPIGRIANHREAGNGHRRAVV